MGVLEKMVVISKTDLVIITNHRSDNMEENYIQKQKWRKRELVHHSDNMKGFSDRNLLIFL
jgi:hypothetical protein